MSSAFVETVLMGVESIGVHPSFGILDPKTAILALATAFLYI
jgi:hypothetical protein